MRQVIIVLIALLALSILTPSISAKQGATGPFLVSSSNMSKVTPTPTDPDIAVVGITSTMASFLNGTYSGSSANFADVMNYNYAGGWEILKFLSPTYTPVLDVIPASTSGYKLHQMG